MYSKFKWNCVLCSLHNALGLASGEKVAEHVHYRSEVSQCVHTIANTPHLIQSLKWNILVSIHSPCKALSYM